jgi:uncharacterized protein (UPF0332 family)/predicted nucleotidyltransferase
LVSGCPLGESFIGQAWRNLLDKSLFVNQPKISNVTLLEKKHKALDYFLKYLLSTEAKKYIAKIILFGSVAKKKATQDSDVDVLVVVLNSRRKVEDLAVDASVETSLAMGESVEPIFCDIDETEFIRSYFIYRTLKVGKEVYSMNPKELKINEAEGYYRLSKYYLETAEETLKLERFRAAVDLGYNAAELCMKALLLFELNDLPTSHGGIVNRFGDLLVKTGVVEKEIAKAVSAGLQKRNDARYKFGSEVLKKDADSIIEAAGKLQTILVSKIKELKDKK